MRILTCLKQVREPESLFDIADGRLAWRAPGRWRLSSLDEFALEEALLLKDADPGVEVWAVTVGPAGAEAILRRSLGMGADRATHILTPDDEEAPRPPALAAALAAWARPQAFDLILCGVMSEDAMQGMVGPLLARALDLPWVTAVSRLERDPGGSLRVERDLEGGSRQRLALGLPGLVTVQSSTRQPRYPALSSLLKAKKAEIPAIPLAELAPPAPREELLGVDHPRRARAGRCLEGSTAEKATQLLAILRERALL